MVTKKIYFTDDGEVIIRRYMLKDLAAIYQVSSKTMRRWINEVVPDAGEKTKKFFTVLQVQTIVNAIGKPYQSI